MNHIAKQITVKFGRLCNTTAPDCSIIDKAGDTYIAIHIGAENPIYATALSNLRREMAEATDDELVDFADRVFLKVVRPRNWLRSDTCRLLQSLLAESLTIGKSSLGSQYHAQAMPFVAGKEQQIKDDANHVVYGRRGAGKSTLILHACNRAQELRRPFAWIALQQYQGRQDPQVIPQCLYEIVEGLTSHEDAPGDLRDALLRHVYALEDMGDDLTFETVKKSLPRFSREMLPFVNRCKTFYIFLDDLHLLHPRLQPCLLSAIYSFARGNNIFLKISAIENLTRLYDASSREGIQTPGDAQVVRLDYNLVNPDEAHRHISHILDGYVRYMGIPGTRALCADNKVLERLTWVSAGVPRDALYIFNNSIGRARALKRPRVTVTDVNLTAAQALSEKKSRSHEDAPEGISEITAATNDITDFCRSHHTNAFLVRIDIHSKKCHLIDQLCDLRFIHVLNPGMTPEKAGQTYKAFMLDYAFYTGFRRAQSIKEFFSEPKPIMAKDLRKLPRYDYDSRL